MGRKHTHKKKKTHYSSFASYVMCHYYIKKSYGPTERGIVTYVDITAAVATSVTSLHEAPRESPGGALPFPNLR